VLMAREAASAANKTSATQPGRARHG